VNTAALQNEAAAPTPAPATLTSEMTEQLAGFRAYVRFEEGAQAEVRQVVQRRLAHGYRILDWQ
jgi:hypothetical protein